MKHKSTTRLPSATILSVLIWISAGLGWAAIEPHPEWVNTLQPRGVPGPELTLSRHGKSDYSILLSATPTKQDKKAAEELAHWLGKMTGVPFPLLTEGGDAPAGPVISIGRTEWLATAQLPQQETDLGNDGIGIGAKNVF